MSSEKPEEGGRTRIIWTDDELNRVIEEAVQIALADKSNIWMYIAAAQEVLESNRRRKITGRAQINPDMIHRFVEARREILDRGIPFEVQVERIITPPREELLASLSTDELVLLLARRLGPLITGFQQLVQNGLVQVGQTVTSPIQPLAAVVKPAETHRKKKVLVYGFTSRQNNAIEEGAGTFDLELVFRDKGTQEIPRCDYQVVMNKLRSDDRKHIKAAPNAVFVNGVSGALQEIANINSRVHQV